MKAGEQAQVDFIIPYLRKGCERKEILQNFSKLFKVTDRTFDNRLKIAKKQLQFEIVELKGKVDSKVDKVAEVRKIEIMSALDRMELLQKIAKGEILVKKPYSTKFGIEMIEVEPDHNERKGAIAELNKMDGSYAAQKQEVVVKEANIDLSKLTDDELHRLAEIQAKTGISEA